MKVKHKVMGTVYEVYNIRDDKKGYPHFLIYTDNQWLYVSAKSYIPITRTESAEN